MKTTYTVTAAAVSACVIAVAATSYFSKSSEPNKEVATTNELATSAALIKEAPAYQHEFVQSNLSSETEGRLATDKALATRDNSLSEDNIEQISETSATVNQKSKPINCSHQPLSTEPVTSTAEDLAYQDKLPARSMQPPLTAAESKEVEPKNKPYDRLFPLMAQRAFDLGYELPKPYGLNLSYMHIRQNIDVDSIQFDKLNLNTDDLIGTIGGSIAGIGDDQKVTVPGLGEIDAKQLVGLVDALLLEGVLSDIGFENLGQLSEEQLGNIKDKLGNIFDNLPSDTAIPSSMFNIQVESTRQWSKTENLRFDTWVLPFLNVYAILGHTRGGSTSHLDMKMDLSSIDAPQFNKEWAQNMAALLEMFGPSMGMKPEDLDKIKDFLNNPDLSQLNGLVNGAMPKDIAFNLKFQGITYGAGMTLAGGYGNMFTIIDANLTRTSFDILDGQIDAFTLSPRVGYRFNIPAMDLLNLGPTRLNIWAGAMYQKVQQEFRGKISDLNMPSNLQGLIGLVNSSNDGTFRVKQHLNAPLNMTLGAQYEFSPNFNILTEFGFNKRNSFFVAGEYRF